MTPSMSRKGDCWDNAPTERFFRILKSEQLSEFRFATKRSAYIQVIIASPITMLFVCIRL
jgi:transposase InsO family protein